ncbi:MAG TPA: hypothetical protein VFD46_10720 [Chryseolinea sp.]|nr:hypothetical protein [Chryseolinea sp.]
MRLLFLCALVISCGAESNVIKIEINSNNQFIVNGSMIDDDNLKDAVLTEKNRIVRNGGNVDEISIELRVDTLANVGSLGRLETVLRKLNFKKIKYIE